MMRLIQAMVLSIVLICGVTGCAVTSGKETAGEFVDDATITTRVKAIYAKDPEVSAMRISVKTMEGKVMLSGTAKSQAEKDKAESVAKGVSGVKSVQNDIVVDSSK